MEDDIEDQVILLSNLLLPFFIVAKNGGDKVKSKKMLAIVSEMITKNISPPESLLFHSPNEKEMVDISFFISCIFEEIKIKKIINSYEFFTFQSCNKLSEIYLENQNNFVLHMSFEKLLLIQADFFNMVRIHIFKIIMNDSDIYFIPCLISGITFANYIHF